MNLSIYRRFAWRRFAWRRFARLPFTWADLVPSLMTLVAMAMGALIYGFFMFPYSQQVGYDEGYEAAATERVPSILTRVGRRAGEGAGDLPPRARR
jgi:hypothetical protein